MACLSGKGHGKKMFNKSELLYNNSAPPLGAPPEAPQVTEEVEESSQDQKQPDEEDSNPPGAWQRAGARFECPICGRTRNTQSQMQKHLQIHDEEEEDGGQTCQQCSYQTTGRDQLIEHMERTHTQNNLRFKCEICLINFNKYSQ